MPVKLIPVDAADRDARLEIVHFVNSHYPSELPLDEATLSSERIHFFWAIEGSTGKRVGCTAFIKKTKYLAESVKTVVDPIHRGRRLGEAISHAIEQEVRARGFTKLMSTILVQNLPMLFIKLKQGFIVEGIHMDHEKPGLHEYSVGKVLT